MKTRLHIILILVLAGCLILPAIPVSAATVRQDFTGTFICNSMSFEKIKPAGPITQFRGWSDVCEIQAAPSSSLIDGTVNLSDGVLVLFKDGLSWKFSAKFRIETSVGSWEGSLQGKGSLVENVVAYQAIAHGVGSYEGLQLHMFVDPYHQEMEGYILDPGK
jgi:hypothetical protein